MTQTIENPMNLPTDMQTIFTKVAAHLRKQGKQSKSDDRPGEGSCMYRGGNGSMCAIGIFIPDEYYNVGMERSIGSLLHSYQYGPLFEVWDDTDMYRFLQALQQTHDTGMNWSVMGFNQFGEDALREVAEMFGLVYTPGVDI